MGGSDLAVLMLGEFNNVATITRTIAAENAVMVLFVVNNYIHLTKMHRF